MMNKINVLIFIQPVLRTIHLTQVVSKFQSKPSDKIRKKVCFYLGTAPRKITFSISCHFIFFYKKPYFTVFGALFIYYLVPKIGYSNQKIT